MALALPVVAVALAVLVIRVVDRSARRRPAGHPVLSRAAGGRADDQPCAPGGRRPSVCVVGVVAAYQGGLGRGLLLAAPLVRPVRPGRRARG